MNEEELKQKAEEYARKTRIKDENTYNNFEDECISETQDYEGNYIYFPKRIIKAYIDGFQECRKEFENLKCCGNCKHCYEEKYDGLCCDIFDGEKYVPDIEKRNCDKWEK